MAVTDRFIYTDIGSYGKGHDSTIFQQISFWQGILKNNVDLPQESHFPGIKDGPVSYFLVGDEAFSVDTHLLRPYGGNSLSVTKRIFNYRLSRARRYVECVFGILSNK